MSLWALIKSVVIAVALSPFVAAIIGTAVLYVRGMQSLVDTLKLLVVLPFGAALFLIIGGVPVLLGTSAVAGALVFIQRNVWSSPVLLWLIAVLCLASIPIFMGRYPHGDGGTFESVWETIKAMLAASIATWCIMAAVRSTGQA